MPATLYGLSNGEYEARPDFIASRDSEGKWTASNSYTMPRDTWEGGVKDSFTKGTQITSLFPQLNTYWSFLELENWEVRFGRGGLAEVTCSYNGFNDAEYESDREVTYILSGTLVERPMIQHPLFLHEMNEDHSAAELAQIIEAYHGMWVSDPRKANAHTDDVRYIVYAPTDGKEQSIEGATIVSWWVFMIEQGNRTYKAPTLRWTKETASLGGLSGGDDGEVAALGLVVPNNGKPPGNPPQPFSGKFEWLKVSLQEVRTSGSSSTSEVWELSPPGGFPKLPNRTPEVGIYDYDLSKIDEL